MVLFTESMLQHGLSWKPVYVHFECLRHIPRDKHGVERSVKPEVAREPKGREGDGEGEARSRVYATDALGGRSNLNSSGTIGIAVTRSRLYERRYYER